MEADKDNANPTILNPSDLPTRHRPTVAFQRSDGGTGLFDGLVPSQASFCTEAGPPTSSDEDDDDVEPIDEQEVYGVPGLVNRSYA